MRHSTRGGLSPVELLLALVVVVALALGFFQWASAKAEHDKRRLTIRRMVQVETALRQHCADCGGAFPSQKHGLKALVEKPADKPADKAGAKPTAIPARQAPLGWNGPYLDARAIEDAWGRTFKYVWPGRRYQASDVERPFDLASYGRDGCEGGKGLDRDIVNWDRKTMVP